MSLADDLLAALPELRTLAESRMLSTVTIRRKTGGTTTNGAGNEVAAWAVVYTGIPFRLGGSERGGSGSRVVKVGETEVQVATRVGSLPADTAGLRDYDYIEVTAGENAGAVLCIAEATWADQQTARRVPVFEVQRPEGWT